MIKNLREAFNYLHVDWYSPGDPGGANGPMTPAEAHERNKSGLDRRMFKATRNGIPTSLSYPGTRVVGTRQVEATACFRLAIGGPVLMTIRLKGDARVRPSEIVPEVPSYFAEKVTTSPTLWRCLLSWDELVALPVEGNVLRVTQRANRCWVTARVEIPVHESHTGALHFTAYAEGADGNGPTYTVYLPCDADAIEEAVEAAETFSDEWWEHVNGEEV